MFAKTLSWMCSGTTNKLCGQKECVGKAVETERTFKRTGNGFLEPEGDSFYLPDERGKLVPILEHLLNSQGSCQHYYLTGVHIATLLSNGLPLFFKISIA